jgi:methyl-accepting chemotaxis protein
VAAASAEQSAGIGQVSKAMGTVDQVTQRNASASEELSSTAEEMASQAEALQQLVAFFQVNGDGEGHHAPRPAPVPAAFGPVPRQGGHAPAAHVAAAGTKPALPQRRANGASGDGGFKRF